MKVILSQDVARIGHRDEIKDVPSGHALNYLIPQKLVEPATKQNLKKLKRRESKQASKAASRDEAFDAALKKLGEVPVKIQIEANEQGHLFKGIKAEDIQEHMANMGLAVLKEQIQLGTPIKEVGEHKVKLTSGMKEGECTVVVEAL